MSENAFVRAASKGDLRSVRLALQQQTPEISSNTLLEALNRAALNGYLEVVRVLLENGAGVNGRADNGSAPLNCAVEGLHPEIVKYLLENGADVNAQDDCGMTVLHQAIDIEAEHAKRLYDYGDLEASPTIQVTNLLIEAGANIDIKTKKGETPLQWAISQWHKPAEELLRQKVAT